MDTGDRRSLQLARRLPAFSSIVLSNGRLQRVLPSSWHQLPEFDRDGQSRTSHQSKHDKGWSTKRLDVPPDWFQNPCTTSQQCCRYQRY